MVEYRRMRTEQIAPKERVSSSSYAAADPRPIVLSGVTRAEGQCVEEADSYVQVNGSAEIDERPDHFLDWTTRIVSRYVGQERAEEFGRRNAVAGEWLVRVRPSSFVALKNIAQ